MCADAWRSEGGGRNLSMTLCLLFHGREACNWGRLKAIGPSDPFRTVVKGMFREVWLFIRVLRFKLWPHDCEASALNC